MSDRVYDPASGRYLTPYEVRMQTLASRDAAAPLQSTTSTAKSGAIQPGVGQANLTQNKGVTGLTGSEMENTEVPAGGSAPSGAGAGGVSAAQTLASGGSPVDAAGSGLVAAGMASGMNPWLIGGGLALTAASSVMKGKQQREQQKYLAEVQKFEARQAALSKLASLGQGLKA